MSLDLRDVTLCAADSVNMALTARAMHISMERCNFANAVFYSHEPVEGNFRTHIVEKFNYDTYQTFWLKSPTIQTPFALWVQWDGYVTDPRAWHPSFREYDFIGAKWPSGFPNGVPDGMNVGNCGFCLYSKKFNEAMADPRFTPTGENIDMLICKKYRPALEKEFGIRFAPEPVADLFSYELTMPRQPTFGFHGFGNMWRHTDDSELLKIADLVDPYVFRTKQFVTLIVHYSVQCKFDMIERLFAKMRQHVERDAALAIFRRDLNSGHADAIFGLCEQLVERP